MEVGGLALLGRMLPALLLIVGALLLTRRWAQRGGLGGDAAGVKVLARTGLTRSSIVAVVQVGPRRFLVGAADQHVSMLAELDSDDPVDGVAASRGLGQQQQHAVKDLVAGMSGALRAARPPALSSDRPGMGLIHRLQRMTVRTHLAKVDLDGPWTLPSA